MTISRSLLGVVPAARVEVEKAPTWKRVLLTALSAYLPGTGLVWAGHLGLGFRWWLAVSCLGLPMAVLGNAAPELTVFVVWAYVVAAGALWASHLVATWRRTRVVRAWQGRRAALFAVVTLGLVLNVSLSVRRWLAEPFRMPSDSMAPSLVAGDRIFVPKLRRDLALQRGVVVAFRDARGGVRVSRLVGLPGDVVEMGAGSLSVNGVTAEGGPCSDVTVEDFSSAAGGRTAVEPCVRESLDGRSWRSARGVGGAFADGRWAVPPDHVFVLGDRRAHAVDSRTEGPVPAENVLGPVLAVWLSVPPGGWWPRWERIGLGL